MPSTSAPPSRPSDRRIHDGASDDASRDNAGARRIVYLCDWLPPDYGAVGQYSQLFATDLARQGHSVVLCGLSSSKSSETFRQLAAGSLREIKIAAAVYDKTSHSRRLLWTVTTNTRLLWRLRWHLLQADEIVFTGSPPFILHWLAPLNLLLRKQLVYRITDFHPECLIAQRASAGLLLWLFYKVTLFWRRRVQMFEVLGHDQAARLQEIGIPSARIRLKRDPSPVQITADIRSLERPQGAGNHLLLLYSGNWGVAHEYETFLAAYRRHHTEGSGRVLLWLNAVGSAVELIASALNHADLPFVSGRPVPLQNLASLLVTADAHLITLRDPFVGFVLPSKVYGCIASGRPVLFVGSSRSDVHLLCREQAGDLYRQVDVGDVERCWRSLEDLAEGFGAARQGSPTVASPMRSAGAHLTNSHEGKGSRI